MELRGVSGKFHDCVCDMCSRQVIGTRYAKMNNFLDEGRRLEVPDVNLCHDCFLELKEAGQTLTFQGWVDPYWVIIPSLWQFGDVEVPSFVRLARETLRVHYSFPGWRSG